jgi:hypothetical protein
LVAGVQDILKLHFMKKKDENKEEKTNKTVTVLRKTCKIIANEMSAIGLSNSLTTLLLMINKPRFSRQLLTM